MGSNVIKYGPATLARLVAELDEPITSAFTNPAPIGHALVMDRRVHTYDAAALIAATAWRETLARNLRDAAGAALAWRLHRDFELSWRHGDCEAWCPNLDGERAPGWER